MANSTLMESRGIVKCLELSLDCNETGANFHVVSMAWVEM
jgi:hypothetical protein